MSSKDKIIEIAEKLFLKNGFDATSVREISTKAEVNLAMINYYFNSKRGLLEEIIKTRIQSKILELKVLINRTGSNEDISRNVIKTIVKGFFRNRVLYVLITRELNLNKNFGPQIPQIIKNDLENFKLILRGKVVFKGSLDIEMLMFSFFATINAIINLPVLYFEQFGFSTPEEMFFTKNEDKIINKVTNHLYGLYSCCCTH